MKRPILVTLVIASFAGAGLAQVVDAVVDAPYAYAQDAIDQHKADTFGIKMFTRPPGDKGCACFLRRYDAEHLAQHPKQKVAMKLLVAAEIPKGEKAAGAICCRVLSAPHKGGVVRLAELQSQGYFNLRP